MSRPPARHSSQHPSTHRHPGPYHTPSSSSSTVRPIQYRSSNSSRSNKPLHSPSTAEYWRTVLRHDDDGPDTPQHNLPRTNSFLSSRVCPSCQREFSSTRAFDEHLRLCSPEIEKPYACSECDTAFKKNSNLVKHMKLVHLGERNFKCPEPGCGRLFGQKSNLNSHVKAVHLREKPFVCNESNCGKRFSQKSGLKAHIKTVHHGERPYVCECGSSFGHRGDLNRHIRVLHEKQRPYECLICPEPRAFGRKSVLMRHMLTHSQSSSSSSK